MRRATRDGRTSALVSSPSLEESDLQWEGTLAYRPPLAWTALLDFLRLRALPGIERVTTDEYQRAIRIGAGWGRLSVARGPVPNHLRIRIGGLPSREAHVAGPTAFEREVWPDVSRRLGQLFDLAADPIAIDRRLAGSSRFAAHVREWPGVRVPGAFDGFETTVRAILGQQVSVRAATTLAARVVARWGERRSGESGEPGPFSFVFPTPGRLRAAPLEEVGLTRARAETIRALARRRIEVPELFAQRQGLQAGVDRLQASPGIGPWTAHYVAMRVLREPDALPAGDLVLRKAISKVDSERASASDVEKALEPFRPYRAYAAIRLWMAASSATPPGDAPRVRPRSRE